MSVWTLVLAWAMAAGLRRAAEVEKKDRKMLNMRCCCGKANGSRCTRVEIALEVICIIIAWSGGARICKSCGTRGERGNSGTSRDLSELEP